MGREGFQIGSLEELIDRRPTVARRLAKPLAALLLLLLVLPAALSLTGRRQPPAAAFQGRPAGRPLAAARSGSPAGPHRQKPSPRQAQRRARPAPAKLAGQPARAEVSAPVVGTGRVGGQPPAGAQPALQLHVPAAAAATVPPLVSPARPARPVRPRGLAQAAAREFGFERGGDGGGS